MLFANYLVVATILAKASLTTYKVPMPELPEVETLRKQLAQNVIGEAVQDIAFFDERIKPFVISKDIAISAVERFGKYLVICLTSGEQIVIHLRMTGHLLLCEPTTEFPPYTRFAMFLTNKTLFCCDLRRFAILELTAFFSKTALIPNPLENFDAKAALAAASSRLLPVKQLLLEQGFIAGIGNIYACEILFAAQVNPFRKACSLTGREWQRIARASLEILSAGVESRGTSISDWRDLFGKKGEYQNHLAVYGRQQEPCPRCSAILERSKIGGRGTFFCPHCQK